MSNRSKAHEKALIKKSEQCKWFLITKKKARVEDAEDFKAYCVQQFMEGRSLKTSLKYLAADYFRSTMGLARSPDRLEVMTTLNIHLKEENKHHPFGGNPEFAGEAFTTLKSSAIDERKKAIIILLVKFGFTKRECAQVFCLAPSRIAQLYEEGIKQLRIILDGARLSESRPLPEVQLEQK
jgi:hypothetical protein